MPGIDLRFRVEARAGAARAGVFSTPHGDVETPAFMPVGTRASVKGLTNAHLDAIDPEVVLANTYHLHLRPGEALIRELGGLHRFAGWDRPLLTDSGGFQVFSLGELVAVDDDGVTVKSHLDGEPIRLGPREATRIQEALGADVVMAFDQCCRLPATPRRRSRRPSSAPRAGRTPACARARGTTRRCSASCRAASTRSSGAARAAQITALPFEGFAIGGLSVGEGPAAMRSTLAVTTPLLPDDRPRYLMGVGAPLDLVDAVALGVDLFDCVIPTRNGRRGHLFTRDGVVRIGRREFERDEGPLDPECACETCRGYSRAYLHHLSAVGEHTSAVLGSLHNVHFLVDWVRRLRAALRDGTFAEVAAAMADRYRVGEARAEALRLEDPEGRLGSRRRAAERAARRPADRGASTPPPPPPPPTSPTLPPA